MTPQLFTHLLDRELLDAAVRVAAEARRSTADLLALLGEIDQRRLYLGEGFSSLFTYCTQALHLSEHAAYHRIEAARAARQFPIILTLLAEGALTLTTVALLRPHLTPANHGALLAAARQKSKRDVEHQIAQLAPRADVKPLIRRLPAATTPLSVPSPESARPAVAPPAAEPPVVTDSQPRPVVAPLAPGRYLLRITVRGETHTKLRDSGPSLDAADRAPRTNEDRQRVSTAPIGEARRPPHTTHSGGGPASRVGTRRRALCLCRRARALCGDRRPRVPPSRPVRRRRPDGGGESRVAMPRPQSSRKRAVVWPVATRGTTRS